MIEVVTVTSEQMHWHSPQCAECHYNFFLSWHPEKKSWCWSNCFMPYQVPSPLRIDMKQVPQPSQWAEA